MQRLATTLLVSYASAKNELFLNKHHIEDKMQVEAINIDTNQIAPCQYFTNTAIFNLQGITNKDMTDTTQTEKFDYDGPGKKFDFNFCETPFKSTDKACDNLQNSTYAYKIDGPDSCTPFSFDNEGNTDTAGTEIKTDDNVITGLKLTFSGTNDCATGNNGKESLQVQINCPQDVLDGKEKADIDHWSAPKKIPGGLDTSNACMPKITYEHISGCPVVSMGQFEAFLSKYYYLWGAGLIVLGIFLAFFGNKLVNWVLFTVGAFATFVVLGALFFNVFLKKVNQEWGLWVALGGIILVSLGVGFALMKVRKLGISIFAAWGGVMIGFIVTTTFVVSNVYAYYALIGACAVVMFIAAWKIEQTVVILLTAFIGSYSLVRGISLYVGGFPSETELQKELENGIIDWQSFPKTYYGYLAGIIGVSFISAWYQIKKNQKLDESKAEMKKFLK